MDEVELEEKKFLMDQRSTSKHSKGSSSHKLSNEPSHMNSEGSDELPPVILSQDVSNKIIDQGETEETQLPKFENIRFTPFSKLYHSERIDSLEQDYLKLH